MNKADWSAFFKHLDDDSPSLVARGGHSQNMNQENSIIMESIYSAADKCIPKKKCGNLPKRSAPWWDDECTQLIKERKDVMHEYRINFSLENFLKAKAVQAKVKRKLRQKKRQGWQKFCSSLSPQSHSSYVWMMIRRFKGSFSSSSPKANIDSWLSEFLNRLAPSYAPNLDQIIPPQNLTTQHNNIPFLVSPIVMGELLCSLHRAHDSSPGLDMIPYKFLQKAPPSFLEYFLSFINKILSTSSVPECWKKQLIIPILKPHKDSTLASSYRPIALSSCIMKVFEHILKNRIDWFLEHNALLARSQFGFRKSLSCIDNLSILITDIHIAFSKKESTLAVFLDIDAAYDNVCLPTLYKKMIDLSIPEPIAKLIFNIFTGRTIFVNLGGRSECRNVWRGLPQGSVLSPTLFNLYCHDLEAMIPDDCSIIQYADDIAIYCSNKNIKSAAKSISSALEKVSIWMYNNSLKLSAHKSQTVMFSRKHSNPEITLKCEGIPIPQVDEVKFLGLLINRKLSWHSQISHIAKKCEIGINMLRALSNMSWGSHPTTLKLLYNALIRSHLDYASFLFDPLPKTLDIKLDRIQTKSLRLIVGAMHSTPNNSLQVECVDMPLKIRRQYLSDCYFAKKMTYASHPLLSRLSILNSIVRRDGYWLRRQPPNLCESFTNVNFSVNKYPFPSPMYNLPYETLIFKPDTVLNMGLSKSSELSPHQINSEFLFKIETRWPDFIQIYTDGSKTSSENYVGAAVIVPSTGLNVMIKLPPEASVFTAECIAMSRALDIVSEKEYKKTIIFTDSLSLVQTLSSSFSFNMVNEIILNMKSRLFEQMKGDQQTVVAWIPAHKGIHYNEVVDNLAKLASVSGTICNDLILPMSDRKRVIEKETYKRWEGFWNEESSTKGSVFRSIKSRITRKPWFHHLNMSRTQIANISRMRFGHHRLESHLFKINIVNSPYCECGLDHEDLDHVFFSCPLRDRYPLYNKFDTQLPLNIYHLLSTPTRDIYKHLLKFIERNMVLL
jgi:ribonuclease HI